MKIQSRGNPFFHNQLIFRRSPKIATAAKTLATHNTPPTLDFLQPAKFQAAWQGKTQPAIF